MFSQCHSKCTWSNIPCMVFSNNLWHERNIFKNWMAWHLSWIYSKTEWRDICRDCPVMSGCAWNNSNLPIGVWQLALTASQGGCHEHGICFSLHMRALSNILRNSLASFRWNVMAKNWHNTWIDGRGTGSPGSDGIQGCCCKFSTY